MPRECTCNECGTVGSPRWMETHNCSAVQDVAQFGGRCEDYPCCGHANGECAPRESFTKEYWLDQLANEDPNFPIDYEERY